MEQIGDALLVRPAWFGDTTLNRFASPHSTAAAQDTFFLQACLTRSTKIHHRLLSTRRLLYLASHILPTAVADPHNPPAPLPSSSRHLFLLLSRPRNLTYPFLTLPTFTIDFPGVCVWAPTGLIGVFTDSPFPPTVLTDRQQPRLSPSLKKTTLARASVSSSNCMK